MAVMLRELQNAVCATHFGGRALLAACGHRLAHTAAGSASDKQQQQHKNGQAQGRRALAAAAGVPTTIPELPRQPAAEERPARGLCLTSINDPENWGLGASPQGTGEPAYYWLGSSISNPKEYVAPACPRAGSPSPLPAQGFRSAQTRPTMQRIVFRSSMIDPEHYLSSVADPPLHGTRVAAAAPAAPDAGKKGGAST